MQADVTYALIHIEFIHLVWLYLIILDLTLIWVSCGLTVLKNLLIISYKTSSDVLYSPKPQRYSVYHPVRAKSSKVSHLRTCLDQFLPSWHPFLFRLPSSNLTASSSAACWRETSRGCEGRPATPAAGFDPRWPTPRTDPRTPRRRARARPTTPRRRGSLWKKARGAYGRTRRTTAAKPEPDRRPRKPRARRARPSSQLWLFNARYWQCVSQHSHSMLWHFLLLHKRRYKDRHCSAPMTHHLKPTLLVVFLYNTSKAWQEPAAVCLD